MIVSLLWPKKNQLSEAAHFSTLVFWFLKRCIFNKKVNKTIKRSRLFQYLNVLNSYYPIQPSKPPWLQFFYNFVDNVIITTKIRRRTSTLIFCDLYSRFRCFDNILSIVWLSCFRFSKDIIKTSIWNILCFFCKYRSLGLLVKTDCTHGSL